MKREGERGDEMMMRCMGGGKDTYSLKSFESLRAFLIGLLPSLLQLEGGTGSRPFEEREREGERAVEMTS